jgi:hypothetical protein
MKGGRTPTRGEASLWLRWIFANALGEALGLGTTVLIGAAVVSSLGEGTSALANLALAAGAVLAGTLVEGTVVGTAQWSVLRVPLPRIRWRTWAVATGAGAFLAWLLGMIPSTVLSLDADSGGTGPAPAEPSNAVVLGLAFCMGLVLGPVLGFAQWLVLRRFVSHAALWMPANGFAWAFGMVVIFTGIDPAISGGFGFLSVVIVVLTLACAGAVVGAIHGLALVWLLRFSK